MPHPHPLLSLFCSGLFCVKCATPAPTMTPSQSGVAELPSYGTLTWLPFTVTHSAAETTHTLTTLGGVNCPPSCSATRPSLSTPPGG